MSFIIVARNPRNGAVFAITDGECEADDPPVAQFDTEEDAEKAADNTTVCKAWPYSIVEIP